MNNGQRVVAETSLGLGVTGRPGTHKWPGRLIYKKMKDNRKRLHLMLTRNCQEDK